MSQVAHIDFETGARLDLKRVGASRYVECPDHRINCLCYTVPGQSVAGWLPGMPLPVPLFEHVARGGTVGAHNAPFEYAVWSAWRRRDPRVPELRLEQLDCTMARALALSLPAGLEQLCAAIGLPNRKHAEGRKVMLKMAKPKRDGTWHAPTLDDLLALLEYCAGDVLAEHDAASRLPPLTPMQRRLWLINERINQRGVYVDAPLVDRALQLVALDGMRTELRIADITSGTVQTVNQRDAIIAWLAAHGVHTDKLRAADVTALLARDDLPDVVRDMLETRQGGAKASVAKLAAMCDGACTDGRLRGMFQWHGAGTGRAAGRRVQFQNMPRQPEDFEFDQVAECLTW